MMLPDALRRWDLSKRDPRWRDRSGVVHVMCPCAWSDRTIKERVGWYPVCGAHRRTIMFKDPKYCPLPANCFGCLGYVSSLPR